MRLSAPVEVRRENKGWSIDPDGMMRVPAYIIKTGVFHYDGEELPEHIRNTLRDRDNAMEFIDLSSVSRDALASLEGKPLLAYEHEWREAGKNEGEAKEIGSIAGTPELTEDGYIKADLLIKDSESIAAIKDRELIEISAGYMSKVRPEPGEHEGQEYDLRQEITRFNHVVILPLGKGRCGRDVRILNKDAKGKNMSVTIKRTVGATEERYTFNSEDDAREAERMADAVAGVIEKRRQNAEEEAAEKGKEAETLKKENEELGTAKGNLESMLAALNAKLDKLLALEAKEQEGDESAIIAEEVNASDEKASGEVAKELEKANSLEGRRKAVVAAAARMNGVDASKWSQEAVDSQFQMLAAKARKSAEVRKANSRSSNIQPPDGGFKRENAGGEDRIAKMVRERNEANKKRA